MIQNSVFLDNVASETGGAIFLENIKADITQSQFISNEAKKGGAIYSDTKNMGTDVRINQCDFKSNTASSLGAAVIWDHQPMILDKTLFNDNYQFNPFNSDKLVNKDTFEPDFLALVIKVSFTDFILLDTSTQLTLTPELIRDYQLENVNKATQIYPNLKDFQLHPESFRIFRPDPAKIMMFVNQASSEPINLQIQFMLFDNNNQVYEFTQLGAN